MIAYEIEEDMTVCAPLEKISPDVFANGGDRKIWVVFLSGRLASVMTLRLSAQGNNRI